MTISEESGLGKSYVRANSTISDRMLNSMLNIRGQTPGDDNESGDRVSKISMTAENPNVRRYKPWLDTVEHPVTREDLRGRLEFESIWRAQTEISFEAVVQGWLVNGDSLWRIGSQVAVDAPMHLLTQALAIRAAIFEQSSQSGTTTTLELVKPEALRGKPDLSPANRAGSTVTEPHSP
ncbi:MAG: hypothetical protein J0H62_07020 [Rhizobiales bacterium]|nr:hypothetical protein [Hyphomicrobiales bacterium]